MRDLKDDIYLRYCQVPTRKMRRLRNPESAVLPTPADPDRRTRTTRESMKPLSRELLKDQVPVSTWPIKCSDPNA